MKTKCIVVDDEPLAIDALATLLEKFRDMEIIATCQDSVEAFEVLQKKKVDLMFLDIQMPEVTGLNFLRSLQNPPKVILTTAHRDYALEAVLVFYTFFSGTSERTIMKQTCLFYR